MTREFVMTTSWDDGSPLDLRVAELLSKYGLTGTFYVPFETGHPILSPVQVRALAAVFEVGAHTVHHVELPDVPNAIAHSEIRDSKHRLEEVTGRECETFCFPKGRFSKRHLPMLRDAGFRGARTVELLSLKRPVSINGLAMIPTTVQAYSHETFEYVRNSVRRRKLTNTLHFLRICGSETWEHLAVRALMKACEDGGVFHLWGHSWEIEAAGQWATFEGVLALMGRFKARGVCVTNAGVCCYAA